MTETAVPVAPAPPLCPNCGAPVPDRYCGRCGQEYLERLPSLRRMVAEVLDDQFSLNGKLPRTFVALLLRPGFLTREYARGRIERYLRPFRLFLLSSVIFFVALSMAADPAALAGEVQPYAGEPAREETAEGTGAAGAALEGPAWARPILGRLQEKQERLESLPPGEATRVMVEAMLEAAARAVLLVVPAFALILRILHFRRRPLYVEHFVFGLHFHALGFLLLTPAILIHHSWVWWTVGIGLMLYLLIALKRAYGQPWWLAGAKFVVLLWSYSIVIGLAGGVVGVLGLFLV